ncbi:coiled-coil domain-containing protein CG32809-like isoform X2 [Daphnia carinata]|uniref:coiled-coil domain-containing protein CG32809-like isoform X2 n=1 Tax=Daphnia carinata TaxID=120202 RepID=UPI002579EEC7|nr:coiled-coil domain-containing protein CG32809-like isoform X2 [Daphnia carinata]
MSSPPQKQMTMPMLSHSNSLMDEDAGIMSEAETSATGFRRGSKQRASLPVVRTPSKTLERPLGLVFLQFRHETKRALLPNEITTLDTVRALFVRSFARQLSMEYFDSNNVHIYIHDPNQDMFYELEDLRDIRDRSILRLFETDELKQPFNFQSALPLSLSQMSFLDDADHVDLDQPLDRCNPRLMISSPLSSATWDELSYFSEPEFDSDYRPQHVHKSKNRTAKPIITGPRNGRQSISSMPTAYGSTSSLSQAPIMQRNGQFQARSTLHRSYSTAAEQTPSPLRIDRNAMSPVMDYAANVNNDQPARWKDHGVEVVHGFFPCPPQALPPQVPPRPPERSFHNYGTSSNNLKPNYGVPSSSVTLASNAIVGPALSRSPVFGNGFGDFRNSQSSLFQGNASDPNLVDEQTRIRMEQVERKLASLTGLVQTALTSAVGVHVQLPDDDLNGDANNAVLRIPPPEAVSVYKGDSDWLGSVETYTQLRLLQKNAKELRSEMRSLRRLSQAQLSAVKEAVKDTIQIMKKTFLENSDVITNALCDAESSAIETTLRNVHRQESVYQNEMKQLETDLSELETSVESLRSHVINKKTRVSMADVEKLANLLSRSSKSVDQLKTQFPALEESIKCALTYQSEQQAGDAQFLKETPNKLENTIGRCKKLTSTLVTLRRLASVQEQRQPQNSEKSSAPKSNYTPSVTVDPPSSLIHNPPQQGNSLYENDQQSDCNHAFAAAHELHPTNGADVSEPGIIDSSSRNGSRPVHQCGDQSQRTEPRSSNALDTLLDELKHYSETNRPDMEMPQSFTAKSGSAQRAQPPLPAPSTQPVLLSNLSTSKPYAESPVDSVVSNAIGSAATVGRRRAPPPPPPRTSSRSPLASPLRSHPNFQARPLPNLPSAAETNHFTMPLVMKVAPMSPQSALVSNCRQARTTPPTSNDSRTLGVGNDARKINTARIFISTPSSDQLVGAQDGQPLRPGSASSSNFMGSRRTSQVDSSVMATVIESGVSAAGSPKRDHLESRHQELLKTQKHLQEQYDRLQRIHGTQLLPVALGVGGEAAQSSQQSPTLVVAEQATNAPDRRSNGPSTGTLDSAAGQNDHPQSVENRETEKASPANGISSNDSQSSGHSSGKIEQSALAAMNPDGDKSRESIFISLLLENAHETDIL